MPHPALLSAIEHIRALSRIIDECVESGTDADMLRFIVARRDIPEALRMLANQCEAAIEQLPAFLQSVARIPLSEKRTAFQRALAEIQAKWPVSSAKIDLQRYRADKQRFNAMLDEFLGFIRTHL
jgi:hypothetical protein